MPDKIMTLFYQIKRILTSELIYFMNLDIDEERNVVFLPKDQNCCIQLEKNICKGIKE